MLFDCIPLAAVMNKFPLGAGGLNEVFLIQIRYMY